MPSVVGHTVAGVAAEHAINVLGKHFGLAQRVLRKGRIRFAVGRQGIKAQSPRAHTSA